MEEQKRPVLSKRASADNLKEQQEALRTQFNVSSRTKNVADTVIISTILQGITGENQEYAPPIDDKDVELTPYQQQMLEWQTQRDKTSGSISASKTLQMKIEELQAQKRRGNNRSAAHRKSSSALSIELKDEGESARKGGEVVGLDDAWLELRLQEEYINKKLLGKNSGGSLTTQGKKPDISFGLDRVFKDNDESGRKVSIKDGKQLIALAYGLLPEGGATSSMIASKDSQIDLNSSQDDGSTSQQAAFNASMSQLMGRNSSGQDQIFEEEEEDDDGEGSSQDDGGFAASNSHQGGSVLVKSASVLQEEKVTGSEVAYSRQLMTSTQNNVRSKEIIVENLTSTDRNISDDNSQSTTNGPAHHVIDHIKTKTDQDGKQPKRRRRQMTKSTTLMFPAVQDFGGSFRLSMKSAADPNTMIQEGEDKQQPGSLPNSSGSKRRQLRMLSKANTIQEISHLEKIIDEESVSSTMMRRAKEQEQGHMDLKLVCKYFSVAKRDRTKVQTATLVKYLKTVKIFKDVLLRGEVQSSNSGGQAPSATATSSEYVDAAFEHLASNIKVTKVEANTVLMEEGTEGDLFYIILEGKCDVLKSSQLAIHSMTHSEAIEDRTPPYFNAFMDNYEDIFWSGMDITQQEVDEVLGIVRDDDNILQIPEWPISKKKQQILQAYVRKHEKDAHFRDSEGQPTILVNRHLIQLEEGAGFGELALMSDMKRMASVVTSTDCVLATLTKVNFSNVLRRAQKRQMASQVGFLKKFAIFKNLSQMKLQKLFYLLKECDQPKGTVLFRQRDTNIQGVYLIKEGEVAYEIKHEVIRPDYSKNPSWSSPSVLQNNLDRKAMRREVALFTNNDIVGYEEILRKRLLGILKAEFIDGEGNDYFKNKPEKADQLFSDSTLDYRNFTAIVKSSSAKLFFLKREDLEAFLRFMPNVMVREEVLKRVQFLSKQINTIMKVTKDEFDEQQKIELAKQLITRKMKYTDVLTMPATEREELDLKVKESIRNDRNKTLKDKSALSSQKRSSFLQDSIESSPPRAQMISIRNLDTSIDQQPTPMLSSAGKNAAAASHQARYRSSLWTISQTNAVQDSASFNMQIKSPQAKANRQRGGSPSQSDLKDDSIMSSAVKAGTLSSHRHSQVILPTPQKLELSGSKRQQQIQRNSVHSFSVERMTRTGKKSTILPSLSTERPMFDDPYNDSQRSSNYPRVSGVLNKSHVTLGRLNQRTLRVPKMATLQNESPSRGSSGGTSQNTYRVGRSRASLPALNSHSESKRDIGAKIVIEEDDLGKVEAEDFVQKNFNKYHHVHDSDNLSHSCFGKASISDQKQISRIRAAEHNAIQRKQDAFRNRLQQAQIEMLTKNETPIVGRNGLQNASKSVPTLDKATPRDDNRGVRTGALWNESDLKKHSNREYNDVQNSQRSTQLPTSQQAEKASQFEIEKAIHEEETEFNSRMLEVLDGIAPLMYDSSLGQKRIDAMHEKMSETCEIMASRQMHSYRKSDDALLDKNSLGPVYCKILKQRRRRGSAYKKEVMPVAGKSVQTDFPEITDESVDNQTSAKKKRLKSELSLASLARYSSMRSFKPEKDFSAIDSAFMIKSIDSTSKAGNGGRGMSTKATTLAQPSVAKAVSSSLDRSRHPHPTRAKFDPEFQKHAEQMAGFLQPRLQVASLRRNSSNGSNGTSTGRPVAQVRTKNATNQKLRDKLLRSRRKTTHNVMSNSELQPKHNDIQSKQVVLVIGDTDSSVSVKKLIREDHTTTLSVKGHNSNTVNNGNVSEDVYSSISVLNSIENPIMTMSRLPHIPPNMPQH